MRGIGQRGRSNFRGKRSRDNRDGNTWERRIRWMYQDARSNMSVSNIALGWKLTLRTAERIGAMRYYSIL